MTVDEIFNAINGLNSTDKQALIAKLAIPALMQETTELKQTEERFIGGRVCLDCGSVHVVRNGHRPDGVQRYLCRDCGVSFVVATNSVVSGTTKDLSVWQTYIDCMLNGLSIRKTAEKCGIHRNTSFIWRHKILDSLQAVAKSVNLEGIVEADETFFALSFKGNHKNSKSFTMPRKAHKRGGGVHTRGLSHEQVCVPCAINRNGMSIAKPAALGKVSISVLHSVYDDRIAEGTTVCTDKEKAYRRFSVENKLSLIQLENGKSSKGIYSIQHINSYHSKLKNFMKGFNGVSTKYLPNYLIWHNVINHPRLTTQEKENALLSAVLTLQLSETNRELSDRPPIPFKI